jgi:hypothetical protein
MQSTSVQFDNLAKGYVRPLSWQVRASFDKSFDPSITFFTLDTSLLDGPDVLAPEGNNVIPEWAKYNYADYSDRVISVEITQEQLEPYSVVQSFADVVLNNYDSYFTPNAGSPIDQYILPKRPFKLFLGFGDENAPQFFGLSTKTPEIDKGSRTAKFHLIDFLSFIFELEIGNTDLLTDVSTGEALDYLFTQAGLLPGQFILDETSFNRIPFFYVEKGQKLGTVVRELMEAEQGRLFMDELGIIRFLSRQSYNTTPVYTFTDRNTIDYKVSDEDEVINFVRIQSDILAEFTNTPIWGGSETYYIPAGATLDVWASLDDIQTAVVDPTYSETEVETSFFTSTLDSGGSTPYTDISLDSIDKFAKSVKMTFENTGTSNAYITKIELWGNAVRVSDTITVEDSDQTSIDNFDLRLYDLKTRYIQKESNAISKASILLDDYKDYGSILEIDVKGNMALQIGDIITANIDGNMGEYAITKIVQIMADARFTQRLTIKNREFRTYFILSSDSEARSLLDGTDVLPA